jgi:eukaryotic-like serine/threonine-protein kinase
MNPKILAGAAQSSPIGQLPLTESLPDEAVLVGGDYALLKLIGSGGMGEVWQARQLSTGREVAVKLLRHGAPDSRFNEEVAALARLEHPGIVRLLQAGTHYGRPFLAMEMVSGETLASVLARGPLPPRRAAEIVEQCARALQQVHKRGLVHRDLKPSNILLNADGNPSITDFGLVKNLARGQELTLSQEQLGTPAYMAPEQVDPERGKATPLTDIYGLGATLYHALTGNPPFRAESPQAAFRLILTTDPVPPRRLNQAIPSALETVCLKALAREPNRRYASAQALADDLRRWQRGEPVFAQPISVAERLLLWANRHRAVTALAGLALAFAIVGLVTVLKQRTRLLASNRAMERIIGDLRLTSANDLFRQDQTADALRLLATEVREHPANLAATRRLVGAIARRSYLWPIAELGPQPGEAVSTTWSPDGRLLASLSVTPLTNTAWVTLWDVPERRRIGTYQTTQPCWSMNFSPDSSRLALSMAGGVALLSCSNFPAAALTLPVAGPRVLASFLPDGSRLAVVGVTNRILVWQFDPLSRVLSQELPSIPLALDFCETRASAFSVLADGSVREFDASLERSGRTLWTGATNSRTLLVNRLGDRILLGSGTAGNALTWTLHAAASGETIAEARAEDAKFSPDGRWVLLMTTSESLLLQSSETGKTWTNGWTDFAAPSGTSFLPDSSAVVGLGYNLSGLQLRSVPEGKPLNEPVFHQWLVEGASVSPDGKSMAISCDDSNVVVWTTVRPRSDGHTVGPGGTGAFAFSQDGRRFVAAGKTNARLWDVTQWRPVDETWPLEVPPLPAACRFDPSGQWLGVATGTNLSVRRSHDLSFDLNLAHPDKVLNYEFGYDGSFVAAATTGRRLYLWSLPSGKLLHPPLPLDTDGDPPWEWLGSPVYDLRIHPLGQSLGVALHNGQLQIWRIADGQRVRVFDFPGPVVELAFSEDGTSVAGCSMANVARLEPSDRRTNN